jgi:DNA-binding GntR family transcriptional regulator
MAGNPYLLKALETSAVPLLSYVLIESRGQLGLDLKRLVREHRDWLNEIEKKPAKAAGAFTRQLIGSFWEQVSGAMGDHSET